MIAVVVAVAVLGGFVAGTYLRELAGGFAPDPDPELSRRAEARAAFRGMLRARPRIGVIELLTACVCGLVAWRFAPAAGLLLPAYLYLGVAGVALAAIDARTKRLPDAITLPSYPIGLVLLAVGGLKPLLPALAGMTVLGAFYGVLWFIRPSDIGFGDVKLAGVLGLFLGRLGLEAWVIGAFAGHLVAAVYAIGLLVTRRATLKSDLPFGPFMLLGALAGVIVGAPGG